MTWLHVLCWVLLFVLKLRFPPGSSLATISQIAYDICYFIKSWHTRLTVKYTTLLIEENFECRDTFLRPDQLIFLRPFQYGGQNSCQHVLSPVIQVRITVRVRITATVRIRFRVRIRACPKFRSYWGDLFVLEDLIWRLIGNCAGYRQWLSMLDQILFGSLNNVSYIIASAFTSGRVYLICSYPSWWFK